MAEGKFNKVNVLPGTLEANAFYLVLNGNYCETYLTNSSAVAKMVGNSVMINELIDAKLAAINSLRKVANIAARNALVLMQNTMVLVADATGDGTVSSGAALYFYDSAATTYTKVAEYESMDAITSWASISGKPSSSPAQIDSAVANAHTHSNSTVLNALSDVSGELRYNGNPIPMSWTTANW